MSRPAYIPLFRYIFAIPYSSFGTFSWPASGRVVTSIVASPFPPPGRGTVWVERTMVDMLSGRVRMPWAPPPSGSMWACTRLVKAQERPRTAIDHEAKIKRAEDVGGAGALGTGAGRSRAEEGDRKAAHPVSSRNSTLTGQFNPIDVFVEDRRPAHKTPLRRIGRTVAIR